MQCPRCKSELTAKMRGEIEIDVCGACNGIWLDGGELSKIVEQERAASDAEARENWRMYDRGRDHYEAAPAQTREKGTLESLLEE